MTLHCCPFCGSAARINRNRLNVQVICSRGPHSCGGATLWFPFEEEAVAAWNNRPTTGSAPDMFDQDSPATQAINTRILNLASPAVFGPGGFENALVELINKIDTSLDSGDLLIDARRASAALDSIFAKGDLVANAHDYFRDSPSRYENSVEFSIGWNACLDAICNARAALLAASMGGDQS